MTDPNLIPALKDAILSLFMANTPEEITEALRNYPGNPGARAITCHDHHKALTPSSLITHLAVWASLGIDHSVRSLGVYGSTLAETMN